jgi:hypothetical protein
MAFVEIETTENFVLQMSQSGAQVIARGLGAAEQWSDTQWLRELPSRDLGSGLDLGISGDAETRFRAKSRAVRLDEMP